MNYGEFINIFKRDYNLDCFYTLFLKKKKEAKKILKEDVDDKFLEFLVKNKIEREEEIKVFLKLYNDKLNLNSIYLSYRGNFISLKDLENIKDMDNLKYIVLNKYKDYLKEDIDKIDNIDFKNIMIFIIKYPNFYKNMEGNKYLSYIFLDFLNIERDLNFLRILGIKKIEGDFDCSGNKNLKSLRGCPNYIGGNFYCKECGLEELGMERGVKIEKFFDCKNNKNLKNLRNGPIYVGGIFDCSDCGLEELGMEKEVKIEGGFNCSDNKNLKSLRGCPQEIDGYFECSNCGLEELGMQKGVIVKGYFSCSNNKNLKSLKNSPSYVGGSFNCDNCGLEELGMQEGVIVKKYFDCSDNENLKSLKGCPKFVGVDFICYNCNLNEINLDTDITIEKDLYCLRGNNVTKEQVERYIKKNNINLKGGIR